MIRRVHKRHVTILLRMRPELPAAAQAGRAAAIQGVIKLLKRVESRHHSRWPCPRAATTPSNSSTGDRGATVVNRCPMACDLAPATAGKVVLLTQFTYIARNAARNTWQCARFRIKEVKESGSRRVAAWLVTRPPLRYSVGNWLAFGSNQWKRFDTITAHFWQSVNTEIVGVQDTTYSELSESPSPVNTISLQRYTKSSTSALLCQASL